MIEHYRSALANGPGPSTKIQALATLLEINILT